MSEFAVGRMYARVTLQAAAHFLAATLVVSCSSGEKPAAEPRDPAPAAAAEAVVASRYLSTPSGNTVIVFVHGVFGDADTTWKAANGASWPELMRGDEAFAGVDLYTVSLPSPMILWSLSINELADRLPIFLDAVVGSHKDVVFLAHSMGGLVVRQYLMNRRDAAAKTRMIYFFATPTQGSQMAELATAVGSRNPQLKGMARWRDAEYVGAAHNQWIGAKFPIRSYCAYEKIPYPLVGLIVPPTSATALCNEVPQAMEFNHEEIVKPGTRDDIRYLAFRSAFEAWKAAAVPAPTLERREYSDGVYQEEGMKACPKGFAVGGANLEENRFLCRRVVTPEDAAKLESLVDTGTVRGGARSCPTGMYVRGIHVQGNRLLCSGTLGGQAAVESDDGPANATQDYGMHVCPSTAEGYSVLTGLGLHNNHFRCSAVDPRRGWKPAQ
jgi:pimeloyl-ACP methyl ester carboxylesterase